MQNLAYIGSDKKVHTIKVGMLGNTMQRKEEDLQNLGYIDQDGNYVGNNMLQKLGYIGQDGEYHGNEMLQKLEYAYHGNQGIDRLFPKHKLMNLAYLNPEGKVVSKNTGLLGAVKPMNLKQRSHSHHKKMTPLEIHAAAEKKELLKQHNEKIAQNKFLKQKQALKKHKQALEQHAKAEARVNKEHEHKHLKLQNLGGAPAFTADDLVGMGVDPLKAAEIFTAATTKAPKVKGMPKPSKAQQAAQTATITASLIKQGVSPTLAGQIAAATVANGNGAGAGGAASLSEFNALQNLGGAPAFTADDLVAMGVDPLKAAEIFTAATTKAPKVKGMPKPTKAQKAAQTATLTASLIKQGVSPTLAGQIAAATVANGNGAGAGGAASLSEFNALQNLAWLDEDGQITSIKNGMLGSSAPSLENLAWLGKDGKVHHTEQNAAMNGAKLLGASAPLSLQNLSQFTQDVQLGNTEYALISLWFVFTAIVFGLLYKITKEAVCDDKEEKVAKKTTQDNVKVEYLDTSARESFV